MAIPVSLEDAARQLGLTEVEAQEPDRGDQIQQWIADAAEWVEGYTGYLLTARDVTEQFRVPSRTIELRAWPIAATAVPSVAYIDVNGAPATVPGARLDTSQRPARVLVPAGFVWPLSRTDQLLSVTIRAGYEDGAPVPGAIRRAMLVLIAAYDADREGGDVLIKAEATARVLCDRANLRLRRC